MYSMEVWQLEKDLLACLQQHKHIPECRGEKEAIINVMRFVFCSDSGQGRGLFGTLQGSHSATCSLHKHTLRAGGFTPLSTTCWVKEVIALPLA